MHCKQEFYRLNASHIVIRITEGLLASSLQINFSLQDLYFFFSVETDSKRLLFYTGCFYNRGITVKVAIPHSKIYSWRNKYVAKLFLFKKAKLFLYI